MPQIRIRDAASTLRTIARIRMRDEGGTLRTIRRIRARDATGALRTVFSFMSLSVSPTSLSQTGSTSGITTGSTTVTIAGGIAPFSYQWQPSGGENSDAITIVNPLSATTAFRRNGTIPGEVYSGVFECVVTDGAGVPVTSDPVSVSITRS